MGSGALLVSAPCPQWQNTPGVGAPPTARAGAVSRDIWKFQCPCGWLLPGWVIQRRASCSPQLCYTLTSSIMIHPPSCSGRNSSARKAVLQGTANPSCTECGQRASPCCPRSKPRLPARGTDLLAWLEVSLVGVRVPGQQLWGESSLLSAVLWRGGGLAGWDLVRVVVTGPWTLCGGREEQGGRMGPVGQQRCELSRLRWLSCC